MSKLYKNNAETIGGTPLVKINHISDGNIYGKLENRNPAMSVKCRIGASMVAIAVRVMERARLAFAMKDITLDASPLGDDPTSMIPAATSGGNPKVVAMVKPTMGMMVNWQARPSKTPLGIFTTPTKSL